MAGTPSRRERPGWVKPETGCFWVAPPLILFADFSLGISGLLRWKRDVKTHVPPILATTAVGTVYEGADWL